jgi:hypothetical protein
MYKMHFVCNWSHRRHPYHALPWFPFCCFTTCRTYIHFPCRLYTNEGIRALLTIGDVNIFKNLCEALNSKVDSSVVLINKDLSLPIPNPGTLSW